jgi:hypothetical protein
MQFKTPIVLYRTAVCGIEHATNPLAPQGAKPRGVDRQFGYRGCAGSTGGRYVRKLALRNSAEEGPVLNRNRGKYHRPCKPRLSEFSDL